MGCRPGSSSAAVTAMSSLRAARSGVGMTAWGLFERHVAGPRPGLQAAPVQAETSGQGAHAQAGALAWLEDLLVHVAVSLGAPIVCRPMP